VGSQIHPNGVQQQLHQSSAAGLSEWSAGESLMCIEYQENVFDPAIASKFSVRLRAVDDRRQPSLTLAMQRVHLGERTDRQTSQHDRKCGVPVILLDGPSDDALEGFPAFRFLLGVGCCLQVTPEILFRAGGEELFPRREVPVERRVRKARFLCDEVERHIRPVAGDGSTGSAHEFLPISLLVGANCF